MGAGSLIASLVIPIALFGPKAIEAGILFIVPGVLDVHNRLGNSFGAVLFASLVYLLHRISNQRHLRGLTYQGSRWHSASNRQVLRSWQGKASGHRKFEAVGSCLGGRDKEHRSDHRPERRLEVLGSFEAGKSGEEVTDISCHLICSYSVLAWQRGLKNLHNRGPRYWGMVKGWQGIGPVANFAPRESQILRKVMRCG